METITGILIKSVVSGIFDLFKEKKNNNQSAKFVKANIEAHFNEVIKWSERIQFYGMSVAEPTDNTTIELKLDVTPRKFRGIRDINTNFTENSLLENHDHYLLLGDPGSGKTTTLKRLARKMFLEPATSREDIYQYPIVIRLRELEKDTSLFIVLAEILGLKYEIIHSKPQAEVFVGKSQILINGDPIKPVIIKVLNNSKALLLLDGLDEINDDKRELFENEIRDLAYGLINSKLIVSSRSGDFTHHFDGFNIIEICPLDNEQINLIATKWLDNPKQFMQLLEGLPYEDLINRPLFLTQLLFFYKNYGYLPEQPSTVYKKIVGLVLEEWDAQRKIIRKSKYAGFNPDRKIEFLAALSYHLTYKSKTKVFSTSDLIEAYHSIYELFNLPKDEAEKVAGELETHTGIIVESGYYNYEFFHLSLQEYLCGYYIVREPFSELISEYLKEYPVPLAISVALSSKPSHWFAALILKKDNLSHLTQEKISMFLSRLISEKPYFTSTTILGFAILKLFFEFGTESDSYFNFHFKRLLAFNGVKESLVMCLTWYFIDLEENQRDNMYLLKRRCLFLNEFDFEIPEKGFFPKEVLDELVQNYSAKVATHNKLGEIKIYKLGKTESNLLKE